MFSTIDIFVRKKRDLQRHENFKSILNDNVIVQAKFYITNYIHQYNIEPSKKKPISTFSFFLSF